MKMTFTLEQIKPLFVDKIWIPVDVSYPDCFTNLDAGIGK